MCIYVCGYSVKGIQIIDLSKVNQCYCYLLQVISRDVIPAPKVSPLIRYNTKHNYNDHCSQRHVILKPKII